MNGCDGCYSSEKGKQEALRIVRENAKQYAIKNECTVIIYHISPLEVGFMEHEAARSAGINPLEYITCYA